jgi:hypothetical protein
LRKPRVLQSISDCDSDYAKDESDRKSISGQINTLGGMTTNWTSKKQNTVSLLSSSAAEYQALSECVQESVFTQNLIEELTGKRKPAIIYEDNLGTIFLVKNQQVSSRTKHIDIRHHHYMRDLQDNKALDVRFKRSENNSADIMTKNTTREVLDKHTHQISNSTLPFWKEDVKEDSSVTEFTKSQSLAASTVTTSPGDSSISTNTVKSRTSKQPLEKRAGSQAACVLSHGTRSNGRKHCTSLT